MLVTNNFNRLQDEDVARASKYNVEENDLNGNIAVKRYESPETKHVESMEKIGSDIQIFREKYTIDKEIEAFEHKQGSSGNNETDSGDDVASEDTEKCKETAGELRSNKPLSSEPQTIHVVRVSPINNGRESVDSIVLRNNANNFVSNIIASAITQVENHSIKLTSDEDIMAMTGNECSSTSLSQRTLSAKSNTYSTDDNNVDERAKDLVNDVLSKAIFQINKENDVIVTSIDT